MWSSLMDLDICTLLTTGGSMEHTEDTLSLDLYKEQSELSFHLCGGFASTARLVF